MTRAVTVLALAVATTLITTAVEAEEPPASTQGGGTAVVQVRTHPATGAGRFRFTGIPAGELTLAAGGPNSLTATGLPPGPHVSILAEIDPVILAAGYTLVGIRCDDVASPEPSTGDVPGHAATFRIDEDETVTCVFDLARELEEEAGVQTQECICPKQGPWKVDNHQGQMVCTGSFSITRPLKASRSSGTVEIRNDCETIIASGMSEDEATIEMHRQPDCGYKGTVGGSQDGIPMTIEFTWLVHSSVRITGDLQSTVSKDGMTCNMSRDYELRFSQ